MQLKTIFLLILIMLSIIVFVQNMAIIEYRFLFWYLALPKAIFSLLFMVIGISLWVLVRLLFKKKKPSLDDESN